MSPRWFDGKDHLALDTGGGPIARLWSTALSGLVDIGYVKATGHSVVINLPSTHDQARGHASSGRSRSGATRWSATAPAPTSRRTRPPSRCTSPRRRWRRCGPDAPRPGRRSRCPTRPSAVGFTEAVRGVLSHHMVIRDGKIANYHPYPPTPWNASVRDTFGTPGPYEDAVQNTPIFEENPPENFKGIDIMRAVRSFDPCLPCGVHMYLGNGKVLKKLHTPHAFASGATDDERADERSWPAPMAARGAMSASHGPAALRPHGRRTRRGAARRRSRARAARCAGAAAEELVRELLHFYEAGLARLLDGLVTVPGVTEELRRAGRATSWSAGLLALHGLHPVPIEDGSWSRWTGPARRPAREFTLVDIDAAGTARHRGRGRLRQRLRQHRRARPSEDACPGWCSRPRPRSSRSCWRRPRPAPKLLQIGPVRRRPAADPARAARPRCRVPAVRLTAPGDRPAPPPHRAAARSAASCARPRSRPTTTISVDLSSRSLAVRLPALLPAVRAAPTAPRLVGLPRGGGGRRAGSRRCRASPWRCPTSRCPTWTGRRWTMPVRLAFVFVNSSLGQPVALYPSPAGATESQLPPEAWDGVLARQPDSPPCSPDVEALLLHRRSDGLSTAYAGAHRRLLPTWSGGCGCCGSGFDGGAGGPGGDRRLLRTVRGRRRAGGGRPSG